MTVSLRRADDQDWYVYTGMPIPHVWYGMVAENSYMRIGLGGIYKAQDGRWWTVFSKAPGVRGYPVTMAKAARQTFAIADGIGEPIHAMCNHEIPGAAFWLQRLGFIETDELIEGHAVWVRR